MVEAVPVAPDSIVLIITRVEDPQGSTPFINLPPSGDDTDGPEPVQYSGADDIIDLFHKLCDVKNKAQEIRKERQQKEKKKSLQHPRERMWIRYAPSTSQPSTMSISSTQSAEPVFYRQQFPL